MGNYSFPFVRLEPRVFEEWQRDFPETIQHNLFLVVRCKMGKHAWSLLLLNSQQASESGVILTIWTQTIAKKFPLPWDTTAIRV